MPRNDLVARVEAVERSLEGIEFDALPLRKLRDFLENTVVLDPNDAILPGTADPDTFFTTVQLAQTIQNLIDNGDVTVPAGGGTVPYPTASAAYAPNLAGWQYVDTALTNARTTWTHFIPAANMTVTGLSFYTNAANNGAFQKVGMGIYQHNGTSLLAVTDEATNEVFAADTWVRKDLITPLALTAGTIYRPVFRQNNSLSSSLNILTADFASQGYQRSTGNSRNFWLGGHETGGALTIPDPLPASTVINAVQPFLLLHTD